MQQKVKPKQEQSEWPNDNSRGDWRRAASVEPAMPSGWIDDIRKRHCDRFCVDNNERGREEVVMGGDEGESGCG